MRNLSAANEYYQLFSYVTKYLTQLIVFSITKAKKKKLQLFLLYLSGGGKGL